MQSNHIYIKKMAGIFPDANSVEDFWLNLQQGKVAKKTKLDAYWKTSKEQYSDSETDRFISMDYGHIVDCEFKNSTYPRQIQGAIDVGLKLLKNYSANMRNIGLVIATEWTDPSFYDFHTGKISKEDSYDVERQINAIKIGLKLTGPAVAIDTACASSLYAIEIARGMLSSSNLNGVIILGLNLYLHSFLYRGFTKLGALSKTGFLKSFDSSADGIVPGEAVCGILVDLEVQGAIAEISGIGLSSDGNEGSPFSPGLEGQISAYKRAYQDAKMSPQEIDYIEAHGTATVLGDETECRSLEEFFKPNASKPIIIGSSKANIGHTLAASGLAAIIKSALMIKHKTIPPHIFINPSPKMIQRGIKTIHTKKKIDKKIIKIGISSFGFGGSNGHLIIQTPEIKTFKKQKIERKFYINKFEIQKDIHSQIPILENVPMGPKMQERIDPLQRLALKLVQDLIKSIPPENQKKLSCIFLNNLGGTLSLDFEKKYQFGLSTPELSIEAIASTLPSMLSGFPTMLFNFRGTHMLISGGKNTLGDLLNICPYLLNKTEGDIILGVAHQNLNTEVRNGMIGVIHITKDESRNNIATVQINDLDEYKTSQSVESEGDGSSLFEFLAKIISAHNSESFILGKHAFTLYGIESNLENFQNLKENILQRSKENKEIALEYLNLLKALTSKTAEELKVGEFLVNCRKNKNNATAELLIDENHPYFFDHPLDHVPGTLTIHGAEELTHWFLMEKSFVSSLSIKFTRFLEKNKTILLNLIERVPGIFDCEVKQDGLRAGTITLSVAQFESKENHQCILENLPLEDKKYLHKHSVENILISSLNIDQSECWALELNSKRGPFFYNLEKPSALYYAEISRQFVMLLAHLRKNIPLNTKMNLILTEIRINKANKAPFKLVLKDFLLSESEDFLIADVLINFVTEGEEFGEGRIKAQVVSTDYYQTQRNKI